MENIIFDPKLLIIDVDSTLTDGLFHVSDNGVITKTFYTRDTWAIEQLVMGGQTKVLILTGSDDKCVNIKFKYLEEYGLEIINGCGSKWIYLESYMYELKLKPNNLAFIGDAENDLECMQNVGWSACPYDAVPIIKDNANYISDFSGGNGAVYDSISVMLKLVKEKQW